MPICGGALQNFDAFTNSKPSSQHLSAGTPMKAVLAFVISLNVAVVAQVVSGDAQDSNAVKACIEPQPVLRWEDYQGPMQNIENLARKFDRQSDHKPAYKQGTVLCSREVKDRFVSFIENTIDPITLISTGFSAGLDHASHRDPSFRMGTIGYAKRFGAEFAGQTAWRFLVDFGYPTLFSEDPRYYSLGEGSVRRRLFHAVKHVLVAYHENGKPMFNYSEWLGTASAVALSDTYHPGNQRGIAPMAHKVGLVVVQDMGMDVLKEFWPDLVHTFHMPFRDAKRP
jgi:hypothetical protein